MATYLKEIEDLDIIIEQSVEFDKFKEKEYINIFNSKIDEGIIKRGTDFFSESWIITIGGIEKLDAFPNEIQFKQLSKIFNKNSYDFELAYRAFLL